MTDELIETTTKANPYYWAGLKGPDVGGAWALLEDLVAQAVEGWDRGWDAETVREQAELGNVQVWFFGKQPGVVEGVLIGTVVDEPKLCVLYILGIAGRDLRRYIQFIPDILSKWAKAKAVDEMRAFVARPELAKLLEKHGWRQTAVLLRLPV